MALTNAKRKKMLEDFQYTDFELQKLIDEEEKKKKTKYETDSEMQDRRDFLEEFSPTMRNDFNVASFNKASLNSKLPDLTTSNGSNGLFQSGAFSNGYDFGDVAKTILGSATDIGVGFFKGAANLGEGIGDAAQYGIANVSDFLGADDFAEKVRKNAQISGTEQKFAPIQNKLDNTSIFGKDTTDFSEMLGYTGGIMAIGALTGGAGAKAGLSAKAAGTAATAATTGSTFMSSTGSGMSQAYNEGATDSEANKYGLMKGTIDAGTELLFGGLGKLVNATGLSKGIARIGGESVDDMFATRVSKAITNTKVKNAVEAIAKTPFEGLEEVIAGVLDSAAQKLTYNDEDFSKIIKDQDLFNQFLMGALVSGTVQVPSVAKSNASGRDYISNLTENETKVLDNEVNTRSDKIKKQQAIDREVNNIIDNSPVKIDDTRKQKIIDDVTAKVDSGEIDFSNEKVKSKDLKTITEQINRELERGDFSIRSIENTLFPSVGSQIDVLEQDLNSTQDETKKANIEAQIANLRASIAPKLQETLKNDSLLQNSYREARLKGENFTYEVKDTDSEYTKKLAEEFSAKANNQTKTHETFEFMSKLSNDRGTQYHLTSTEELNALKFDGEKIHGLVNKDGEVLINIDSKNITEAILGHETTHLLETTKEYEDLQKFVKQYAETKGEYKNRLAKLEKMYEGTDANIDNELTADMVGEYLFTDTNFVNSLSTDKPNIFKRIYDEVKHLYKLATAGSKEARDLEKVKKAFDKAYKANVSGKSVDGTKYSLGYHAGDLGKSEYYSQQGYSRGTGHFGTGTYFVGDKEKISNYNKRNGETAPQHAVEFDNYNLYKVRSDNDGYKLHDNLKVIDGSIDSRFIEPAKNSQWEFTDYTSDHDVDALEKKYGNSLWENESQIDNYVNIAKKYDIEIQSKEEFAKENKYEKAEDEEYLNMDYLSYLEKTVKEGENALNTEYRKFASAYNELKSKFGASAVDNAIQDVIAHENSLTDYESRKRADSNATVFMKSLGYEGIDTRGTTLDNTTYGSVIYDVKPDTVRYSLSDTEGNALTKEQQDKFKDSKARDDEGRLKVLYHGTQNGGFTKYSLDNITENRGNGYDGKSMSNNARNAYSEGKMPLSKWNKNTITEALNDTELWENSGYTKPSDDVINELSKLPLSVLKERALYSNEWHHTGALYNATDFYGLDFNNIEKITVEDVKEMKSKDYAKKMRDKKIAENKPIADELYNTRKDYNQFTKDEILQYVDAVSPLSTNEMEAYRSLSEEELRNVFVENSGDNSRLLYHKANSASGILSSWKMIEEYGETTPIHNLYQNDNIRYQLTNISGDTSASDMKYEPNVPTAEKIDENIETARADVISGIDTAMSEKEIKERIIADNKWAKDLTNAVDEAYGIRNKGNMRTIINNAVGGEYETYADLRNAVEEKYGYTSYELQNEQIKDAKDWIKSTPLKVNDIIKGSIADYSKWAKNHNFVMRFSKDGIPVDVAYEEMSSLYPNLFPVDTVNDTDRLLIIGEVSKTPFKELVTEPVDSQVIDEISEYVFGQAQQYVADSNADVAKRLEELKSLNADVTPESREFVRQENYVNQNRNTTATENSALKIENYNNRIAEFKNLQSKSMQDFNAEIANKKAEYDAIKNKNTVKANDILGQIKNLQVKRDTVNMNYSKRINILNKSINKLMSEEQKRQDTRKDTRAELKKALLGDEEQKKMFIDALDGAKDLSKANMNNTDTIRLTEKIFDKVGRSVSDFINDTVFQKVIDNDADSTKWQNAERNSIKELGIKARSKESAAVQKYAEKKWVDENNGIYEYGDAELAMEFPNVETQNKIKNASKVLREKYDTYIDQANAVLERLGYEPIKKRADYMMHFQQLTDVFSKYGIPFNASTMAEKDLPTSISGITEGFSPGKNYFSSMQPRKGIKTTYDAITGIDKYIGGVSNLIYHTDDIQRVRAFEDLVRDTFGDNGTKAEDFDTLTPEEQARRIQQINDNHLSNYAAWLHEYGNSLAGKTNYVDRAIENAFGRKGLKVIDELNKQTSSTQIGLNVGSALTNLIAPIDALAKTQKFAFAKGTADTIRNIFVKDSFIDNNRFLTSRMGTDMLSKNAWQKTQDIGFVFMKGVDWFASNQIVRSKYYEFKSKGMSDAEAHAESGKFAARIMGDRTKGAQPMFYNSKMLNIPFKYQLEVNNKLNVIFHDTFRDAKAESNGNAMKVIGGVAFAWGQLAAYNHIYGTLFKSVAGYNPTLDVISILATALGLGDDEDDKEKTTYERMTEATKQLFDALPYVNLLTGGGRIPITSGLPNVYSMVTNGKDQYGNDVNIKNELMKPFPYLLPTGGNQIKKTIKGLEMFDSDKLVTGSYTNSGNLRYPVEETPLNVAQAAIFGQYANQNAKDYFENERKPLKEKQIQEYKDLEMPIKDYWKYREGLADKKKVAEKFDFIDSLNVTNEQKNIMANNIVDRETYVDMSDYSDFGSYEEFDFASKNEEKYNFFKQNGISYADYAKNENSKNAYSWAFKNQEGYTISKAVTNDVVEYRKYASDLNKIESDKDANGNSISGSSKDKKKNYIANTNLDYGAKAILYKTQYKSDNTYNNDIVSYLASRNDISYEDKVNILTNLDMSVDANGNVTWGQTSTKKSFSLPSFSSYY